MAKLVITTVCFFFTVSSFVIDQREHFDGDQVLRVIPSDKKQIHFLQRLETDYDYELDFWKQPYNLDKDVDFRVPKRYIEDVKHRLTHHKIPYTVLIQDVQKLIDMEFASMESRSKRSAEQSEEEDESQFLNTYNSHSDINAWLERMVTQCGSRCELLSIASTREGRPLQVIKITGTRQRNNSRSAIWIDGGIHGREWIAPATAVNFIYKLITDMDDRCTRHIVEAFDWYILPVVNPDGYDYSRIKNRMWRKNRIPILNAKRAWWTSYYWSNKYCYGVDLNRNFGFAWGEAGVSSNPCSDIYGGASSFSEPESAGIKSFMESVNNIRVYLSLHSYGQYWLYPWGYTKEQNRDHQRLEYVAQRAVAAIRGASNGRSRYTVGSAARTLYVSSGGSDDWAKGSLNIKYSFTVELPPSDEDAYGNGFVLPAYAIAGVVNETWPGIQAMAAAVLTRDRAKNHARHRFCGN